MSNLNGVRRGLMVMLTALLSPAAYAEGDDLAADAPRVTATLGGRLHWDFADFDNDGRGMPNRDDDEIRRLWVDVSGRFFGLGYKLEADFAGLQNGMSKDGVEAKDVYVTREFSAGRLTLGQFKQHFTLDDRISSNNGRFLERGMYAQTIAPLYRLGAGWLTARDHYTLAGSVYSLESIDAWQVKGRAFAARATWAPWQETGRVLHLGLSAARERYDHPGRDGAAALRVSPRPAGHLSEESRVLLIDFGAGRDTDVEKSSLEFGAVRGPLYAQAEIGDARFDDGHQRGRIDSAYALVSWLVTGESVPYERSTGRFGRVVPSRPGGAWELALRYDTIRGRQHALGAADFRDVSMDAVTLGANWYLRRNLRFMLDWTQSRNRDRLHAQTLDRTRALTGRLQIDF